MQVEVKAKAMVGLADSNDKNVPKGNLLQPWQANVENNTNIHDGHSDKYLNP